MDPFHEGGNTEGVGLANAGSSIMKAMKKASEITEDDLKNLENDCQKITDKYIAEIDKITAEKEKEIMSV